MLAEDAQRAGCDVAIEAEDGVVGSWDRTRLEQVRDEPGLQRHQVRRRRAHPAHRASACEPRARLTVRDHGIGMAAAERGRIFERFERAVSAKHYGGLGLGLYIVRRIVDAHGGEIAVESAPGAGAAVRRRAAAVEDSVARFDAEQEHVRQDRRLRQRRRPSPRSPAPR